MNKYNPEIHHRRSVRWCGYDYSWQGLYFVTLPIDINNTVSNKNIELSNQGVINRNTKKQGEINRNTINQSAMNRNITNKGAMNRAPTIICNLPL